MVSALYTMLRSSACAREDEEGVAKGVAGFDAWRQVHNFTAQVCERKEKGEEEERAAPLP